MTGFRGPVTRYATDGAGRYDRLHGDEPEIEAERSERKQMAEELRADGDSDVDSATGTADDQVPASTVDAARRILRDHNREMSS